MSERLLNEIEASTVLNVGVKTLQAWRCRGKGPQYFKVGRRVFYGERKLSQYLESCIVHPSEC